MWSTRRENAGRMEPGTQRDSLSTQEPHDLYQLFHLRTFLGNMMGSLESWLLLRSLRTLHLRVARQSQNATELARWLSHAAEVRRARFLRVVVLYGSYITEPYTGKGI